MDGQRSNMWELTEEDMAAYHRELDQALGLQDDAGGQPLQGTPALATMHTVCTEPPLSPDPMMSDALLQPFSESEFMDSISDMIFANESRSTSASLVEVDPYKPNGDLSTSPDSGAEPKRRRLSEDGSENAVETPIPPYQLLIDTNSGRDCLDRLDGIAHTPTPRGRQRCEETSNTAAVADTDHPSSAVDGYGESAGAEPSQGIGNESTTSNSDSDSLSTGDPDIIGAILETADVQPVYVPVLFTPSIPQPWRFQDHINAAELALTEFWSAEAGPPSRPPKRRSDGEKVYTRAEGKRRRNLPLMDPIFNIQHNATHLQLHDCLRLRSRDSSERKVVKTAALEQALPNYVRTVLSFEPRPAMLFDLFHLIKYLERNHGIASGRWSCIATQQLSEAYCEVVREKTQ